MTIGIIAKKEDETTNEQVITGGTRNADVEDALTTEQKTGSYFVAGFLVDAPGADDEEIASTDSIIDSLLRQAKEEEAAGEASEYVYGLGETNQPESVEREAVQECPAVSGQILL